MSNKEQKTISYQEAKNYFILRNKEIENLENKIKEDISALVNKIHNNYYPCLSQEAKILNVQNCIAGINKHDNGTTTKLTLDRFTIELIEQILRNTDHV